MYFPLLYRISNIIPGKNREIFFYVHYENLVRIILGSLARFYRA